MVGRERAVFRDPANIIEARRRYGPEEFTPSQLRLIQLLLDGKSLDKIAEDFDAKVSSIQQYEISIAEKMGEVRTGEEGRVETRKRIHRGFVLGVIKAVDEGLVDTGKLSGDITFNTTPDEEVVWQRLMDGEDPQIMAKDLGGSIDVPGVIGALYEKLEVKNEFQAVVIGKMFVKRVKEKR